MSQEDLVSWMIRIGRELGRWDMHVAARVLRQNNISKDQLVKAMYQLILNGA